jgi:type II secretory pathway component PulF
LKAATTGLSTRHDCFTATTAILSGKSLSAAADPNGVLPAMKMNFTALGENAGKRSKSKS